MTESQTPTRKLVPLRPGMFEMPESLEGTPRLYGSRCTACGEIFADTRRVYCANCSQRALERITLGTTGEVYSYTTVRQPLRGSLIEPPYVIARVRLPEGVSVQTVLSDIEVPVDEPPAVEIGMAVEICLKALKEDEDGNTVVNFFFRPARA